MRIIETPVLIAGGGPVGLGMAVELGWSGVPNVLVDQGDGSLEHPRTGLIAVRTMELFRRWGMADAIRHCGFPEDYELSMVFCTSLHGHLLAKEAYPSMKQMPTPQETPEKKQRCPQLWMQPILLEHARRQPDTQVLLRHRLDGFEQDDTGVTAQVTDLASGEALSIRSRFLLGCDGATSQVRDRLGIAMPGRTLSYSVNILLRCPGFVGQHLMGEAERYLFVGEQGTWGNLTVVDGDATWRLTVLGSQDKMDLARFDPHHWIRKALGRDDIPYEIESVQPWRRSETLAERYVDGRVILVGDSAHTMSPTGGMGMNTGMQEVLDLGWKLKAVLEGWGGPKLMPSYEAERRPVAERNMGFSTANFRSWQETPDPSLVEEASPEGSAARTAVGKALLEGTRVEWESLGLQIGHRYEDSPIVVPDGSPATPDDYSVYVPTSRPGSRAPHARLRDGRSTLDLFGRGFVLLAFDARGMEAARELAHAFAHRHAPVEIVDMHGEAEAAALYGTPLAVVRPDGHVAWRGERPSAAAIAARVTGW